MSSRTYIYQLLIVSAFSLLVIGCSELSTPEAVKHQAYSSEKLILVNFASKKTVNAWQTGQSYSYRNKSWKYPAHIIKSVKQIERDYRLTELDDWPIESLNLHCVLYSVDSAEPISDVLERINADSRVAFAEKLEDFELMGNKATLDAYTDPLLPVQHPDTASWIAGLHQFSTGKNIKVGIIDSGIDTEHPDLNGRIHSQTSLISPNISSSFEHGTAVAGIIGASAGNMEGIVGLVPDAALYSYEACGSRNNRTFCDSFTLAKALEYALRDELHILNLSLAGRETPLLRALIDKLLAEGVILIAAENKEQNRNFPAQVEGVHAVGNKMADSFWFANDEQLSTQAGGGYRFFYGTSMSAAGMTGFSAALYSVYGTQDVTAILNSMVNNDCDTPLSRLPLETQQVANHICPVHIENNNPQSYLF